MSRRACLILALAFSTLVLGSGIAAGCGDKFVLVGRSALVARSRYPSVILIWMRPGSRIPAADKEFHLEAVLKAAGHKPVVAESEAAMQKDLASGKCCDLVLADFTDVPELRREAATTASRPVVLPLLYRPTPDELAAAEKEANCVPRVSKQSRDLLVVVDLAMKERREHGAATCEATP